MQGEEWFKFCLLRLHWKNLVSPSLWIIVVKTYLVNFTFMIKGKIILIIFYRCKKKKCLVAKERKWRLNEEKPWTRVKRVCTRGALIYCPPLVVESTLHYCLAFQTMWQRTQIVTVSDSDLYSFTEINVHIKQYFSFLRYIFFVFNLFLRNVACFLFLSFCCIQIHV